MWFRRGSTALVLALAAAAGLPATASAAFHEMLIQEIFAGSNTNPGEAYVTLQMYTSGQNFVNGHTLTVYEADGDEIGDGATFASNVANGDNQSTILIGAVNPVVGVAPDLVDADIGAIDPDGGAACWENLDCVAWGSFTPPVGDLPSEAGTPMAALGEFRAVRSYTQAGCETTLDAVDDTDDGADFAFGFPVPRNNATPPTEVECFNTEITAGPKGRTRNRRPTFQFDSIPTDSATFRCAVDDSDLSDTCTSPHKLPRQSLGKHKLFVWAVNSQNGEDPTPAKRAFKVIRRR